MIEIKILYEDDNIVVVNKPEGLASIHDNAGENEDLHTTLSNRLNQKVLVVHRLDKEVSGVIIYAKNESAHKELNKQFAERRVNKTYLALVHGEVRKDRGKINKPIREFGSGRMGVDDNNGKPSKTVYETIKRFPSFTLLELNPDTGRRHQLRVHLYYIGHPIVGDLRYGEKSFQENFPRLMLHAKSLTVTIKGNELTFTAELPGSFSKCLQTIDKGF
ncbi:MAG: pseudouridine synthase [Ignavibacteria bacterium]|nr:MAG: pseudouridine synthase [Ignavibacteria bacterium]KAF0156696.1 MAG: pseudouridine synthase [Ignavibacteria bacterium]